MRHYLVTIGLSAGLILWAPTAFAAEPSPYEVLSGVLDKAPNSQAAFIRLQSELGHDDIAMCEAELVKAYGAPNVTRTGVKVWEIPNQSPKPGQAKHTTIMLGEENGRPLLVLDDRGPRAQGAATRSNLQVTARSARVNSRQAQSLTKTSKKSSNTSGRKRKAVSQKAQSRRDLSLERD